MLKTVVVSAVLLMLDASAVSAADWTGQTGPAPVNGTLGPYVGVAMQAGPFDEDCVPGNTPPPCGAGQAPEYSGVTSFSPIASIPGGPGSGLYVFVDGPFQDPSSPTGLSGFDGAVPLSAFARSSTVDSLAATVSNLSTAMSGISTSIADLQQQLAMQDKTLRQGVAMSLAMDGTGTLGPDEHLALSMNWGTFGGQNGVAGSVAFRAADHVTFNGGIGTGFHGGLVGGRAGVRIAW